MENNISEYDTDQADTLEKYNKALDERDNY